MKKHHSKSGVVDSVVTHIILIIVCLIFFSLYCGLLWHLFQKMVPYMTLMDFSQKASACRDIRLYLPIQQCMIILTGLKIHLL